MYRRLVGAILIGLSLGGCASSKITAFREPAYSNAEFSRILVFGIGMSLDAAVEVETQICKKVAPTSCLVGKSVLPPTRVYSAEEVTKRVAQSGADAVFILALVADNADSRYLGSYTNSSATASGTNAGTVNLYGNTAYWSGVSSASASSSSVSTPMYSYSREARGALALYESRSGDIVWSGEIKITGNGLLSITDDEFVRSATDKIASDLKAAKLVR
jgi:hypothetical protein